MGDSATERGKVLRVATRCSSLDQFVEAFAPLSDARTLFIASMTTRDPGTRAPFSILLADGTRVMRGQCEVLEAFASPDNPFRRPGVKLQLLGKGGVAVYGTWNGKDTFYTHWAPVPKRRPSDA